MDRRTVDRVLVLIVPVALTLVASTQIFLAHTAELTAWKGGGFGMFATPDRHDHRAVRATVETDQGTIELDLYSMRLASSPEDRKRFTNARALPRDRELARLHEVIARSDWAIEDGVARFDSWAEDEDRSIPRLLRGSRQVDPRHLTITVWRVDYSRSDRRITPRPVGEHRTEYDR